MVMNKKLLFFYRFLTLHIMGSSAINSSRTSTKIRPTQQNMMGNTKKEISSKHDVSTFTTASVKNVIIPNYLNSTFTVTGQNLPMPSPTTQITMVKISTSIRKTSPATNSPRLTAMDATFRTSSLTDATKQKRNESSFNPTSVNFTTRTTFDNKTSNITGTGMKHTEKSMTIMFSVILGVTVLLVLGNIVYRVTRNKQRRVQYSHHPLFNENTGEHFTVVDDTLVFVDGVHDGPQIYNSTVTAINDDQHTFAYTPSQLRLELLHEDVETEQTHKASTFITFNNTERERH